MMHAKLRCGAVVGLVGTIGLAGASAKNILNDAPTKALFVDAGTTFTSTADVVADGVAKPGLGDEAAAWFEFYAPNDGTLLVETCGARFDTVLSIWDGTPGFGKELAFNDDDCDRQAAIVMDMQAGVTYLIRAAGKNNERGDIPLTIKPMPVTDPEAVRPAGAGAEGGIAAFAPDVVWSDITDVTTYTSVGGVKAFSLGTATCNQGLANLGWGPSVAGSPSAAMNAYRLKNGRLMQIGMGFGKQACCAAAGSGCVISCTGGGGSVLGSGCRDVYSSGYNGGQSRLVARSMLNAFTGAHLMATTTTGDSIYKRLQVPEADLTAANNPGALYFAEGVYVASDDAVAGAAWNNASYRRVTIDASLAMNVQDTTRIGIPAIKAWRAHGLGLNQVDNRVVDSVVQIPFEGTYHVACKVTDIGGGFFLYDYAIFNLNSDKSAGSFEIDVPANAVVRNVGFHDVNYHSGEPYDNTDWNVTSGNKIRWTSPQTFQQNPNSNALRWGTMYNFWFECDRRPVDGTATMGLFKPHTPSSVNIAVRIPGNVKGDMNCDGVVNNFDIDGFVLAIVNPEVFATTSPNCILANADINRDNRTDNFDIDPFVALVTTPP